MQGKITVSVGWAEGYLGARTVGAHPHGGWQDRIWQSLLSQHPSKGQDSCEALGVARAPGIGHLPGDEDGNETGWDIIPQAESSPGPTTSPSLAARQQGGGSGGDQALGQQQKADSRAGLAWPPPPAALLEALPLAYWDGDLPGCADPELIPGTNNKTLLGKSI